MGTATKNYLVSVLLTLRTVSITQLHGRSWTGFLTEAMNGVLLIVKSLISNSTDLKDDKILDEKPVQRP